MLESVAEQITDYRQDEVRAWARSVERWIGSSSRDRLPVAELDHVANTLTFTAGRRGVATHQGPGAQGPRSLEQCHLLDIQRQGRSQHVLSRRAKGIIEDTWGQLPERGRPYHRHYVYLDDFVVSGQRACGDLAEWIRTKAPNRASVHVCVLAVHRAGEQRLTQLRALARDAGKTIDVSLDALHWLEDRTSHSAQSQTLWPTQSLIGRAQHRWPNHQPADCIAPRNPGDARLPFSSEQGRQLLERAFLEQGLASLSRVNGPREWRALGGFGSHGYGFGALLVSHRNCPNTCPLALWWGDPDATVDLGAGLVSHRRLPAGSGGSEYRCQHRTGPERPLASSSARRASHTVASEHGRRFPLVVNGIAIRTSGRRFTRLAATHTCLTFSGRSSLRPAR